LNITSSVDGVNELIFAAAAKELKESCERSMAKTKHRGVGHRKRKAWSKNGAKV